MVSLLLNFFLQIVKSYPLIWLRPFKGPNAFELQNKTEFLFLLKIFPNKIKKDDEFCEKEATS